MGQTVGYFLAFTGFMALSEHRLATFAGFMRFWGLLFLLSAVLVVCWVRSLPPPPTLSARKRTLRLALKP